MRTGLQIGLTQGAAPQMTAEMRHAIGLLQMGNETLARHLEALANPHLEVTRATVAARDQWLDLMRVVADPPLPRGAAPSAAPAGGGLVEALTAAAPPGLVAHVSAQLGLLLRDAPSRRIAGHFLEALEPSGWLGDEVAAIARRAGCTTERALDVLGRLQQAEPAGLFARGLAECLRLQAAERGLLTAPFAALLDNLPLAAEGDLDGLALACAVPRAEVPALMRQLRGLDPKPGAAFGDAPAQIRRPDLLIRRVPEGWIVELDAASQPQVVVRESVAGGDAGALRAARWIDHALRRRNATVLSIAAEIVERQQGFLLRGAAAMAPLTTADLAGATGLHRSTVDRVTAALTAQVGGRVLGLRAFLSAPLPGAGNAAAPVATAAARHLLARVVSEEDPQAPLSDAEIARRLGEAGVAVARRTVAKYRAEAGIPPQDRRLRRPGGA